MAVFSGEGKWGLRDSPPHRDACSQSSRWPLLSELTMAERCNSCEPSAGLNLRLAPPRLPASGLLRRLLSVALSAGAQPFRAIRAVGVGGTQRCAALP
jgi:hypothetical protein